MSRAPIDAVTVTRLSTADVPEPPREERCGVAVEGIVTIDVNGIGAYTIMCTPLDARALAVGFLFCEGIVASLDEIDALAECPDAPDVLRVTLAPRASARASGRGGRLVVSSCGVCGSENLDETLGALPRVGDSLRIEARVLRAANRAMVDRQVVYKGCGGTHAAMIFDARGEPVSFAEDVGRHNALDKAIGKLLLARGSTAGRGVALSGRVSLEMITKCARAGIEVVGAVSAPTSLAIEAATRCGITLCAFVRDDRATAFTRADRILS